MKARVKATGEVFEIASYATIPMECCDSFGEPLHFCLDDVEILSEKIESNVPDYWTRLEHQYTGMAMQGLLSNPSITERELTTRKGIIEDAERLAHTLVQKQKEKEERK